MSRVLFHRAPAEEERRRDCRVTRGKASTRMPGETALLQHRGHAVSARRAGGFEKGEHGHDPAIHLPFLDEAKLGED